MKRRTKDFSIVFVGLLCAVLMMTSAQAQEDAQEEATLAPKSDKTGTNPMNFQYEFRVYNEFQWLNTDGDGEQNVTTLEGRMPLFNGKLQLRVRARYANLEADVDVSPNRRLLSRLSDREFRRDRRSPHRSTHPGLRNLVDFDVDESGFGDTDFRLLMVPYANMEKKQAIALGLEVFLDTASEDVLGSGATSLAPQIFYGKFFSRGLFAPGIQYKFSVDEDKGRSKIDQFIIDLNFLFMAKDKLSWFFADPQIVIDNENHEEFAIVDLEYGVMMSKWWPKLKGQSAYIRPAIGVGRDRPTDGSVEVGYKFVF